MKKCLENNKKNLINCKKIKRVLIYLIILIYNKDSLENEC